MPDPEVAKHTSRSVTAVRMRRLKLGIPAIERHAMHNGKWGVAELLLLPGMKDAEFAKMTGRSVAQVRRKRAELAKRR